MLSITPILMLLFAGGVWFLLAASAGQLAERYGRNYFIWFVFAVILSPLVAIIMVWCMGPDEENLCKRSIKAKTHKLCSHCQELMRNKARSCKHCGYTE